MDDGIIFFYLIGGYVLIFSLLPFLNWLGELQNKWIDELYEHKSKRNQNDSKRT